MGYSREELMGMNYRQYMDKEESNKVFQAYNKVYTTGEPNKGFDWQIKRKDGAKRHIEGSMSLRKDSSGKPIGFRGIARDITERKLTERILRENETRLHGITRNLPGIIFQFYAKDSGEFGVNYVSETVAEFSKIVANLDVVNTDTLFPLFLSLIHEEDRDKFLTSIKTAAETETPWNFEGRVAIPSGNIICFQGLSTPTRHKDKVIFDGILLDVTERKKTEEALKESENKYRLLADNIHDVIFVMDMNYNYTYISPSVKILRGYEPEEAVKHTPAETLTPSSVDLALRTLSEIMEIEKSGHRDINISRTLQLEMSRKDGTIFWVETTASLIRDENQRPVGIMGVIRDINERKMAEEKLQQTLESLKKAVGTTIQVLVSALEARDPYTAGHQSRSANLACAIATEMGLSQDKIDGIRMAGIIHDIGKLSIPAEILSKPTELIDIEFSLIKEHSLTGYEMLKNVESPWPLAEIIYQHHERVDGSGYPRNLKGDEILIESRILAVADVIEAMASHRPYRPSFGIEAALNEISKNKGILYDHAVVDACLRLFREKGYQLT
jgi:PAS domain S-box-containing protein/putative nucleotidyltransferase with HDIG domain